jgi:uncharacterized protein (DUF736 family)
MSATRVPPRPVTTLIVAVVLALTATTTAAAAAPAHQRFAESVDLAGAAWTVVEPDATTYITLAVTDGSVTDDTGRGRQRWSGSLQLMYDRHSVDAATGDAIHVAYESITSLPAGAYVFDPSLRQASAVFDVTLRGGTRCRYPEGGGPTPGSVDDGAADEHEPEPEDDCVRLPDVPLSVALEWTGVGPVHRGSFHHREATLPHGRLLFHQLTMVRDAQVSADVVVHGDRPDGFDWPSVDPDVGILLRGRLHQQELTFR